MAENSTKNLAQAQFAKLQRASDAKQAMAEYEADAVAMRVKTARLRELRLARDAELAAAAAAAPAPKPTKAARKPKGTKGTKGTLAGSIDAPDAGALND